MNKLRFTFSEYITGKGWELTEDQVLPRREAQLKALDYADKYHAHLEGRYPGGHEIWSGIKNSATCTIQLGIVD